LTNYFHSLHDLANASVVAMVKQTSCSEETAKAVWTFFNAEKKIRQKQE
jgi:hypothetical protein